MYTYVKCGTMKKKKNAAASLTFKKFTLRGFSKMNNGARALLYKNFRIIIKILVDTNEMPFIIET